MKGGVFGKDWQERYFEFEFHGKDSSVVRWYDWDGKKKGEKEKKKITLATVIDLPDRGDDKKKNRFDLIAADDKKKVELSAPDAKTKEEWTALVREFAKN